MVRLTMIDTNLPSEIAKSYDSVQNVWRGGRVADIGGDVGYTPLYFLMTGAASVVSYTLEEPEIRLAQIEWHKERYSGQPCAADVLKMDCEGCEYDFNLTEVIQRYKYGMVAIHLIGQSAQQKFSAMREWFNVNDWRLLYVTPDKLEYMYTNIGMKSK